MTGQRFLPQYVNTDLHPSLMPADAAVFLKNIVFSLEDSSDAKDSSGNTGTYKTMQSVTEYIRTNILPEGYNHPIGRLVSKETNEVYVFMYNSLGHHGIYCINGANGTIDVVDRGAHFNFQLNPKYFIHEGGAAIVINYVYNPDTGEKVRRTFIFYTDGYNPQGFICKEDAVATNGFDKSQFLYFAGDYDPAILRRFGVPTPKDCIEIREVPLQPEEIALSNELLYNTWQFRLKYIDVWGRPSEYGIISDLYVPGGSDCLSIGARCLDLVFDAPLPHINQIEIAYRKCNSQQWYSAETIDLYDGSPFGAWWLRQRNHDINYDAQINKITYRFCAREGCRPIAPEETNRVYNPIPRTSQALGSVGKYIALANNMDGFNPFPIDLKRKITATIEQPNGSSSDNATRNVTVWAFIDSPFWQKPPTGLRRRTGRKYRNDNANNVPDIGLGTAQPIYRQEYDAGGQLTYGFGGFGSTLQYRSFWAYHQYFGNREQKGFIGYLVGTNFYVESKQYFLSRTGELVEITDYSEDEIDKYFGDGYFLQKFEFTNIPKGHYLFAIAGHETDPITNPDYQSTSTQVRDIYSFNISSYLNPIGSRAHDRKEIHIDVCEGDYDSANAGHILRIIDVVGTDITFVKGYVKDTNAEDKPQRGVELLRVESPGVNSAYTDRNGFYFTASQTGGLFGNNNYTYVISGYCNCEYIPLIRNNSGGRSEIYIQNYFLNQMPGEQNSVSSCPNYENQPCNYVLIKGRVKICDTDLPVEGITVVMTRGGMATTNANGEFTIIARDNGIGAQEVRHDELYFLPASCGFTGCDGGCIAPISITINRCTGNCNERILEVGDTEVTVSFAKGLLSDSTRKWGVAGFDWLGRLTFVQKLGELIIPSVIDTGSFAPSVVRVNIDETAIFPQETEYITFWVGEAVGIQDYITWIVDKVEFVNNAGEADDIAPSQIKIYYGSLLEYNKQNNYNTTTSWQFIPDESNTPTRGDRVTFYMNGDGQLFEKPITAIVKYDEVGEYFLINYTSDLAGLKDNAIMRIYRPSECEQIEPYYEVCSTVNIKDRKAEVSSFILNAFDTYYINRSIPVPAYGSQDGNPSVRIFGVPFEHHSPSDFWGERCHNIGRVNVENPEESVLYHEEQIALSQSLSETGRLNYLNYFEESRKKDFSESKINGIVAVLAETGIVLVIGQSDHFLVGFNDNIARINAQGQVVASSIDNEFGEPQSKRGQNYGCSLFDKNTISKNDGFVHFLDAAQSFLVQHDYGKALILSDNGAQGLIRSKVKTVQKHNIENGYNRYFHGVFNPMNSQYFLSDFIIQNNRTYLNHLRDYDPSVQETFAFGVYSKAFLGMWSFTPQMYAFLEGDIHDKQLFSFREGVVYKHYQDKNETYGTVYGERVNRIIRVVMAADNLKKKKFLSVGVYCKDSLYFIDQALSESGQFTYVPKEYWRQADYGWFAPILCNVNTLADPNRPKQTGENKLADGDMMYGTYLDVRFVGDMDKDVVFSNLQGLVINVSPMEPSGSQ